MANTQQGSNLSIHRRMNRRGNVRLWPSGLQILKIQIRIVSIGYYRNLLMNEFGDNALLILNDLFIINLSIWIYKRV